MDRETALVTGASRGIGKAIALKLADEGMNVVLFGRDTDALSKVQEAVSSKGIDTMTFAGDVADWDFMHNAVEQTAQKFGTFHHIINNAGIMKNPLFIDSTPDDLKEMLNANVVGVYNLTKAALPYLLKQKNGSVITISSLAGKNGFVGGTIYSATKHAVMGFTRSLMLEVRKENIRVAAVCPGSVATDMLMNSPMKTDTPEKILSPEDVAETVALILKLPPRALVSEIEIRPTNPK